MYRTESLVQYFPQLAFLNFIFNFILSCFFLYLKVYANEVECNNDNNNNLYLSVKAKIALTEPLNGDTISEIYIYININVNIKVLKKKNVNNDVTKDSPIADISSVSPSSEQTVKI